jgi:pyrroloquinoline-quinone synthase
MNDHSAFWNTLHAKIARYDLLCHPFYQAWSAGELTREDLCAYATDYYHHVAAFPTYLSAFHSRLADGELRRNVLRNLCDEEIEGTAHSDLWLHFAAGMGAAQDSVRNSRPVAEVQELISSFRQIAEQAPTAAALAAFYAYESQVPRIAKTKAEGLQAFYGVEAGSKTSSYFKLHQTADVHHSQVWRDSLERELAADPTLQDAAIDSAETAAMALWHALSGIERERQARTQ